MNKRTLILLILFFLMSCSYPSDLKNVAPSELINAPKIPSVKELGPAIEQVAQSWQTDAYLVYVHVDLEFDDYRGISMGYSSERNKKEGILIHLYENGDIESRTFEYDAPGLRGVQIFDDEWVIDSPEAMELLWDQVPNEIRQQSDLHCSSIRLYRRPEQPGAPLFWYLNLRDCQGGWWPFYINAATGEFQTSGIP